MSSSRLPIGVFDSGIGGLSVLKEIEALLPHEDLLYIADSVHAPYGNKPQDFIRERSETLTRFLLEQQAKAVVIACNTATAVAIAHLRRQFAVPIVGMEPGVKPAIAATRSGVVGVLATENTLASEQFTRLLHRYAAHVRVISQPCPGLVERIEAGEFDTPETSQLLRGYIEPLLRAGADALVLGCTHYPLLREQIRRQAGDGIALVETGAAVARQVRRVLGERGLLQLGSEPTRLRCWTSGRIDEASRAVSRIVGRSIEVRRLPQIGR